MDWGPASGFVSIAVALCALGFSLFTFFRSEREKTRAAQREFLSTSIYLAERLVVGGVAFVRVPSQATLEKEVMPIVGDLHKLSAASLRWHEKPFYPPFLELLQTISELGQAWEDYGRQGTDSTPVVDGTRRLLGKAAAYSNAARAALLEET